MNFIVLIVVIFQLHRISKFSQQLPIEIYAEKDPENLEYKELLELKQEEDWALKLKINSYIAESEYTITLGIFLLYFCDNFLRQGLSYKEQSSSYKEQGLS